MGNNKKYFWLKLKEDFFRDKAIKKLRKIAGGDTYTIIYLKLQLLSLKNQGKLVFENLEDDFSSEMALELDEEVENVKVTILYLQKCGLLEEVAENEFILLQTIKCIGKETQGAERVRQFRKKEQALLCNAPVTKCNTEIEIEKEIDIDIDIEKEIGKNKIKNFSSDSNEYRLASCLWDYIKINNEQAKTPNLQNWAKQFDLILRIDKRKVDDCKNTIIFCQQDEFWYKNVLSPDKFRKHFDTLTLQMKEPKYLKDKKSGGFSDYEQRNYDFDDLEKKLLGWKDE